MGRGNLVPRVADSRMVLEAINCSVIMWEFVSRGKKAEACVTRGRLRSRRIYPSKQSETQCLWRTTVTIHGGIEIYDLSILKLDNSTVTLTWICPATVSCIDRLGSRLPVRSAVLPTKVQSLAR